MRRLRRPVGTRGGTAAVRRVSEVRIRSRTAFADVASCRRCALLSRYMAGVRCMPVVAGAGGSGAPVGTGAPSGTTGEPVVHGSATPAAHGSGAVADDHVRSGQSVLRGVAASGARSDAGSLGQAGQAQVAGRLIHRVRGVRRRETGWAASPAASRAHMEVMARVNQGEPPASAQPAVKAVPQVRTRVTALSLLLLFTVPLSWADADGEEALPRVFGAGRSLSPCPYCRSFFRCLPLPGRTRWYSMTAATIEGGRAIRTLMISSIISAPFSSSAPRPPPGGFRAP